MKFFCIPASLFACKNGVVEQSDFSQLKLESVPKEIVKSRKHIEELLLNVNSIEELPPDLFRCTKIRRLDVSENKIKVIPTEIGMLFSLEELNLGKNEIVEIPEEIGYCQNLVCLDISTNILTGFPRSFVNLDKLASLNLSNNSLTQLPHDIDRLVNLQFLDVAQCELRSLPASIVRLRLLKVLDLCDNYLTELPAEMGGMASLEMLDLHCNMVGHLPEGLLRCGALRSLDLGGNQLSELPSNIGDLRNLMELTICENQLRMLPSSIGQLKRLEVLKCSKNCLSELTPSICSCPLLTDLILCENQLNELPASIGNLLKLRFLDVNVNNLHYIPSTIGGCQSLSILSLRQNQINELPMEIGKLNKLRVLDLVDNNLKYLPYTLTCLYQAKSISALWLSFNQPPLPKLSTTHEPVMNIKVLTCYLLPQRGDLPEKQISQNKSSCVGGARVCFAGDRQEIDEEDKVPIGRFERYDTPHPKPFAPKNRHGNRNSGDFSASLAANLPAALGSARSEKFSEGRGDKSFAVGPDSVEESRPLRSVLKRRPQSVLSLISTSELMPTLLGTGTNGTEENGGGNERGMLRASSKKRVRKNIQMKRGDAGFEWKIVGGADSPPYKGKTGLFISHVVPDGAAARAGFNVDDQLLALNGQYIRCLSHQEAVQLIQNAGDILEFLIERDQEQGDQMHRSTSNLPTAATPISPLPVNTTSGERCSYRIVRNENGCVPFSVSGNGRWPLDPFVVAAISTSAECPFMPGDRIVLVDATNVKFGVRLDQVRTLLTGLPGTSVVVGIERGSSSFAESTMLQPPQQLAPLACGSAFSELSLSRSLPSLCAAAANNNNNNVDASPSNCGRQQQKQQERTELIPSAYGNDKNIAAVTQNNNQPSPPSYFLRHSSLRTSPKTAFSEFIPPQPFPRHHRSLSNLAELSANNSRVTTEMLRSSTPIEYPPEERPKLAKNPRDSGTQQQENSANLVINHRHQSTTISSTNSTNFSSALPSSPTKILSSPTSEFPPRHHSSFGSPTQKSPATAAQNNLMQMVREEATLNSSSPIQNCQNQSEELRPVTKSSHIPKLFGAPMVNGSKPKIPPPVAPKPKLLDGNSNDMKRKTSPPNTITSAAAATTTAIAEMDEHNRQNQQKLVQSSSSSGPSFSSKLKLFEQMQTTNTGAAASTASSSFNAGAGGGNLFSPLQQQQHTSGIPLKKPLVSPQDMEKMREALEARSKQRQQNTEDRQFGPDEENDEQRDNVAQLDSLLFGSRPEQPAIIRTKKAELRAEGSRIASPFTENGTILDEKQQQQQQRSDTPQSRASSSLSQRAAEIEKRREWRQARLQSMDVESRRTGELVNLISNTTSEATTAQT